VPCIGTPGYAAALLAGALLRELISMLGAAMANAKKGSPFDLGAAYAAKLSANDGQVTFAVGGAEFSMPSAAKWTEDELKATGSKSPFEIIREALGDEEYKRMTEAAEAAGTPFDFGMSKALLEHYMAASGLGSQGES
jgi:hypothetical protein